MALNGPGDIVDDAVKEVGLRALNGEGRKDVLDFDGGGIGRHSGNEGTRIWNEYRELTQETKQNGITGT